MTVKNSFRAGRDLDSLIENVELLTGQRGDGQHKVVTAEELARLKLAKKTTSAKGVSLEQGLGIFAQFAELPPQYPDKPTGFKADGAFSSVLLEWDNPRYRGHDVTEIYRNSEDNLADATLIASVPGQVYGDPVDPGFAGFYWIRFVNTKGVHGAYNAIKGTPAQTIDIDAVFDKVEAELNRSPLVAGLDGQGEKAFLDMWQQKKTTDGITAGIGIVSGTDGSGHKISQVGISAKQLFLYDPDMPSRNVYPFIVDGNRVVINNLIIRDATIQTLRSQRITADEVRAGVSVSAPYLYSATIRNGKFSVDYNGNLQATDATVVNSSGRHILAKGFTAMSGEMNNIIVRENCRVEGTVSAASIDGDILKAGIIPDGGSLYIKASPVERTLIVIGGDNGGMFVTYDGNSMFPEGGRRFALTKVKHKNNQWSWFGRYTLTANRSFSIRTGWKARDSDYRAVNRYEYNEHPNRNMVSLIKSGKYQKFSMLDTLNALAWWVFEWDDEWDDEDDFSGNTWFDYTYYVRTQSHVENWFGNISNYTDDQIKNKPGGYVYSEASRIYEVYNFLKYREDFWKGVFLDNKNPAQDLDYKNWDDFLLHLFRHPENYHTGQYLYIGSTGNMVALYGQTLPDVYYVRAHR